MLPFYCCDKMCDIHNLKEKMFILAHSFNLWPVGFKAETWQNSMERESCSFHGHQEAEGQ